MANNTIAELELPSNSNAHQQLKPALSPPSWFGPHEILQEVEWLVVSDNKNAALGWLLQEIRDSLLRTHRQQQEELPRDFDARLLVEFDRLVHMGDLIKVVEIGVEQQPYRYTLCSPFLPRWFRPEAVLEAVEVLDGINAGGSTSAQFRPEAVQKAVEVHDGINAGGSTLAQIRDSLKASYQPDKPLPPDFDTVLRAMLAVLRQKGHLTWGASGPRHYTRRQAPALVEPNPIHTPSYLWCYYLGYKLGTGDGLLDDSGPDEAAWMPSNPNDVPSWFGPGTVLQVIELYLRSVIGGLYVPGCTYEQIRRSLMRTDQPEQDLPQGFDDALRATLATLSKRGYLETMGHKYKLSITPPCFPPWFGPEAFQKAVEALDDDDRNLGNGWSHAGMSQYFIRQNGFMQPRWFHKQLRAMLSVLRQRGHLTRGARGPRFYTRRDAPAVTVGIPDYDLLCYYVGYKLGGDYILDDIVEQLGNAPDDVGIRYRKRHVNKSANNPPNGGTEVQSFHSPSTSSAAVHNNVRRHRNGEVPVQIDGEVNKGKKGVQPNASQDERTTKLNDWTTEKERRQQQRLRYTIQRVCLSFIGHGILYGLSFIHGFGEETSGYHKEKTLIKWLKWAAFDLVVPLAVLIVMVIMQIFYVDLDLEQEDTSQKPRDDKGKTTGVKTNQKQRKKRILNQALLLLSKLLYASIKKAPGLDDGIAHVVSIVLDMVAALHLGWNHCCLDKQMPTSPSSLDKPMPTSPSSREKTMPKSRSTWRAPLAWVWSHVTNAGKKASTQTEATERAEIGVHVC